MKLAGKAIQPIDKFAAINRVNHVEHQSRLPHLVRLKMPDQMPSQLGCLDRPNFGRRFLDAILAQVERACINRPLHCFRIECLGDGDQGYVRCASAGPFGSARDLGTNSRQPFSNFFGHWTKSYQPVATRDKDSGQWLVVSG